MKKKTPGTARKTMTRKPLAADHFGGTYRVAIAAIPDADVRARAGPIGQCAQRRSRDRKASRQEAPGTGFPVACRSSDFGPHRRVLASSAEVANALLLRLARGQ